MSVKFVEIGIGDYRECNTRLHFEIRNANGLVIDAIRGLKNKVLKNVRLWRNNLTVLEKKIDSSNINQTLHSTNFSENLDLFSLASAFCNFSPNKFLRGRRGRLFGL